MTVHRVVRNCAALSKREFSSGFTRSFVLASSYQNPPPCGNKTSYDMPLRFGVVQAMVITIIRHLEAEEIADAHPDKQLLLLSRAFYSPGNTEVVLILV